MKKLSTKHLYLFFFIVFQVHFIQATEIKNFQLLDLLKIYDSKCRALKKPSNENCMLEESDLMKGGRNNHVILFRGEPRLYPQPSTSALYRWNLGKRSECRVECLESMLQETISDAEKLKQTEYRLGTTAYFRSSDRTWRDPNGILINSGDFSKSALEVLYWAHKESMGLFFEGRSILFDPLVSLTSDPSVAAKFANFKTDIRGIVYIYSIPKELMIKFSPNDCSSSPIHVGKFYDFNLCIDDKRLAKEKEVNSILITPIEFLIGKSLPSKR